MATSKKKPARKTVVRRAASTATLKQPNWRHWMVRPLSLRQAALITMGWEPVVGIIGLLKDKPLKRDEFRWREKTLKAALRARELPRFHEGALLTISLHHALDFAQAKGWKVHKAVPDVLEKIRHQEISQGAGKPGLSASPQDWRPAQDSQLIEIRPVLEDVPPHSASGTRDSQGDEASSRLEKTLLRTLGALAVVLQETIKSGNGGQFLRGSRLNISAVAEHVAATVGEADGSGGIIPGYTVGNMQRHISKALKEYYRSKGDLFDLNPGDPPAE